MVTERHHALDLVRGSAAIGVAVYHAMDKHGILIQSLGMFGVYLFFILSALTMVMVYSDRFAGGVSAAAASSFYRNRIARVLPLLALVAVVSGLTAMRSGVSVFTVMQTILTATGLFSLALTGMLSSTGGAWSLGIEMWFYLVAPLAVMLSTKASLRSLIWLTIALLLAQHIYLAGISGRVGQEHWNLYTVPLTFAPFFAMGFVIYKLGALPGRRWPLVGLACAVVLTGSSLIISADLFRSQMLYLILSAVAFILILAAYRTRLPRVMVPFASFTGDVSYSLYLTHPITLVLVSLAARRFGLPAMIEVPIFLAVALAVSYGTFHYFEKPARDLLRSRYRPKIDVAALG